MANTSEKMGKQTLVSTLFYCIESWEWSNADFWTGRLSPTIVEIFFLIIFNSKIACLIKLLLEFLLQSNCRYVLNKSGFCESKA